MTATLIDSALDGTAGAREPWSPTPVLRAVPPGAADDSLSIDELGSRIVGMAGRLAAATCRWLLLVADFDARSGFDAFGLPSTARWLAHACGPSRRTAVEHVRVARALTEFPALSAAMSSGELSYSQVRAISRLATVDQGRSVPDLVELARYATIGQLEDTVRGLRTVADNETNTDRVAGAFGLTRPQALVRMAEIALAALNDDTGFRPPRTLRQDERAAVVIHLNANAIPPESLEARSRERGGRPWARTADGPGVPAGVALRLACAGRIRTVVHHRFGEPGDTPLDLGRTRRLVSDKQFRALLIRDGGCLHPGCGSRAGLEAHHVRHWLHGGRTDMRNLLLLCAHHHHALYHDEFTILARERSSRRGTRRFRFLSADGRELDPRPEPGRLADSPATIETEFNDIRDDAAASGWAGHRLDRAYAVSVLADRRQRGLRSG